MIELIFALIIVIYVIPFCWGLFLLACQFLHDTYKIMKAEEMKQLQALSYRVTPLKSPEQQKAELMEELRKE